MLKRNVLNLEQLLADSKHNKTLDEIKKDWTCLGTLDQTPEQIETALSTDPCAIGLVRNATQEMMMRCLDDDMESWRFIKNPTQVVLSRVKKYFNTNDEWIHRNKWF